MPSNPVMYYEHALDALKGWPREKPLDFAAKISPDVAATALPVRAGRCVHNTSNGFAPGSTGFQMSIFLLNASDDWDVSNAGGSNWTAIAPTGVMSGLVATGAYEIATTEYYKTDTYAPNDTLHAPTEGEITGADKSVAGLIYKTKSWPGGSTAGLVGIKDSVCGIVSSGTFTDMNNQSRLAFWPVFAPGNSTITAT